jgi:hypothetical protein
MGVNTNRYYQRKTAGVCVRCEGKVCGTSVLCEAHLNYSRGRRKAKCPDDAPWAIPSQVEPARPAYVSDKLPPMPPVPTCCPRCKGFLITQYGDTRCIPCGWVLSPIWPALQPENRGRKIGANLPVVVRV